MTMLQDELTRRLLPLEGGVNFRDMGGYATTDGRRVKWGKLFRSGVMGQLTQADVEHLRGIGFRSVVDLRTAHEQEKEPTLWCEACDVDYWARPHSEVFGDIGGMLRDASATEDDGRAVMTGGFRRVAYQQAPAYAELVRRIAAGNVPIAFNCAAGKDRTGGAAALVLALLGVPRDSIIADFVLTEQALGGSEAYNDRLKKSAALYGTFPQGVLKALRAVHPEYIVAFFEGIEAESGSLEGYLSDLGFTPGDIEDARGHLLEPA